MQAPLAIVLTGPTASGKTQVAVELVKHLPLEIISVDSAMVYRGMDIGTAKPTPDLRKVAPHRLIDLLDPNQAYSAARFRADALREMNAIRQAGRIPLLVGGTMLYFRALQQGLKALPAADPTVRERITAFAAQHGWAAAHHRLMAVDPISATRIHPHDAQRLQRALEVYELTGIPLSAHYAKVPEEPPLRWLKLALMPKVRSTLHQRIQARFHQMLAAGLIDEVEGLYRRHDLSLELPSMRAVGYRQVWHYLADHVDYLMMVEQAITATRQLAKRQLTWLRAEAFDMTLAAEAADPEPAIAWVSRQLE